MTRKRFIKLLMSKGECRNDATIIANNLKPEITYEDYIQYVYVETEKLIERIYGSLVGEVE